MNRGYIAITSALIVSALLLLVVVALSVSSFLYRFTIADSDSKAASRAASEACVEYALLKLALTPSYAGNEVVTITPQTSCAILPITTQGAQKTITASSTVENAVTYLRVTVTLSPMSIAAWEEAPAP